MCVTPKVFTVNGKRIEVACHNCWQCTENKINDWCGRCIAEKEDCKHATVYGLTYGGDNKITGDKTELGASILIYSDVQKWIKRLRRAGFPMRYFLCGEYGGAKGRVHWHVVCFWQDAVPEYENGKHNFSDKYWPHGMTYAEDLRSAGMPDYAEGDEIRAIRYVCKYVQKDVQEHAFVRMSKNPPLGDRYFRRRADTFARQGILPKDAFYSFPDVRGADGMPRKFYMSGVTLDNFCSEFIERWKERYGTHPLDVQHSEFLQNWTDKQAQRETVNKIEKREIRRIDRPERPHFRFTVRFDEALNLYVAESGVEKLFWTFDREGNRAWQDVIRTEAEAARLRAVCAQFRDPAMYRQGRDGQAS